MPRFEELCTAIIRAGLNHIDYIVQAMTASIASHGERLAPLMREAGFRYVFLGIENVLEDDLAFLKAKAKNSRHTGGPRTNTAVAAVEALHRHGMLVVGGLIVGNPDDSASRLPPTSNSRASTSTGRTSSTRRHIPARR